MRRHATLALLAATVLTVACNSMQTQYNVRRENVSCDEANRYAFRSMRSMGYDVTRFEPATVGGAGLLKGNKEGDRGGMHYVTVHLTCTPGEVLLEASRDEFLKQDVEFSRGFYLTFTSFADNAARNAAYAEQQTGGVTGGGVKFKIQPQLGLESKIDFGYDLQAGGVLAVKVIVQNGSDRTYELDPRDIELRPRKGRGKVRQLRIPDAAATIAAATASDLPAGAPTPQPDGVAALLRERQLVARQLRPGDEAEGFVYFRAGEYARARATLVDVETSESEGFLVEF
jgi:hypothetical protein